MKLGMEGRLRLAIKLAFVAGAGAGAATEAVYAQDAAPASSGGVVQVGGVQVTGSRIKQPNLTSSSPVTEIGDQEIQQQGTINVETLLNSLPQSFAGYGQNDSNGASGTATVNLRGLGTQETLVLVDGKRLMPGDPGVAGADLNFIPAALIDKVEVLTGGASAVYGSDAVAGVVNFVMKKDFQGFRIDAQGSRTDHSDGTTYDATMIWGSNFAGGKGNVTLYSGYTKIDAVLESQRGFSSCSLATVSSGTKQVCAGSRTIPGGRIYSYSGNYGYGVIDPAGTRSIVPDTGETFNYAPYNYLQRPSSRYVLGGFAHDEINRHIDVYGSAMFMDNHTVAQVAPSGIFGTRATVPCNSPLLSAQEVDYLCTSAGLTAADSATLALLLRTSAVGNRDDDLRHDQYRIVIGAKGDINDEWSYDTSAQRGQVTYNHQLLNYVNLTNAANALNTTTDSNGNPVCVVGGNCVPLDIFQRGQISSAAAAYITGFGEATSSQVEQVATGSVTGDLGKYGIKSPFAASGVSLATGWEYRTESLDYRPDDAVANGTLGGVGGPSPALAGAFQVNEAFGEMQVPLISNLPYAKLLQIDGAYRWSNYSQANDAHSWKTGFKYQPLSDLTVRGSFQRATRAPSVGELFSAQSFGLVGASDPCAATSLYEVDANGNLTSTLKSGALTQTQCAHTGVTATQYGTPGQAPGTIADCSASQCNNLVGGNLNLKPELSITRTAGIVLTPRALKNFSWTADYFDITIRNPVTALPFNSILQDCANAGDATTCSLIHRGPTGRLSGDTSQGNYVTQTNINAGLLRTKGFDTEMNYRIKLHDMGLGNNGQLVFDYVATYLYNYSAESVTYLGVYECVGRFGTTCGTPNPRYRHKLRSTWDISPIGLSLSADWRYYGDANLDTNTSDPNLTNNAHDTVDAHIGAKQYLDLSAAYILPTKDRNVTLRAGVSNIAGQAPPTVASSPAISSPPFGNGNTYPNVYDALGRVMFVGITADF